MSAVRWGWAGQVVLAGRNHREQRVEQCCRLRSGALSPAWFQTLGWMLQKEILNFFRTARLWRLGIELLGQTKAFWSQRSGNAERRGGGWKFLLAFAEGGDGMRWLPCLCRHHGNVFMPTLLPHSLNWASGTPSGGQGVEPSLFTKERQDQVMSERDEKKRCMKGTSPFWGQVGS